MSSTIGAELERRRLQHRARRMERIIADLKQRALHLELTQGKAPVALGQAIAGFHEELDRIERRLTTMGEPRTTETRMRTSRRRPTSPVE